MKIYFGHNDNDSIDVGFNKEGPLETRFTVDEFAAFRALTKNKLLFVFIQRY